MAGLIHLAFNMWCLWSLGQLSERLFGRWQTFSIYMLAGVGGALLSIARNPQTFEVGASGAIFGDSRSIAGWREVRQPFNSAGEKKALTSSMIFFVGINFLLGAGMSGLGGNIDNMCHLGGFIHRACSWGCRWARSPAAITSIQLATVLLPLWCSPRQAGSWCKKGGDHGFATRVGLALQQKDYSKAISMLESYISSHPADYSAYSFLGEIYEQGKMKNKALDTYERGLKINPDDPTLKRILRGCKQLIRVTRFTTSDTPPRTAILPTRPAIISPNSRNISGWSVPFVARTWRLSIENGPRH